MKIFSKKVIFIAIIAALGSSGVYYYFIRTPRPAYEFVEARRGTIIQQVSVTGRVKPAKSVDLAFEKSGKVAHIYIGVNDKVKAGEVLAVLQNDDVRAQLAQTQAAVESAEAQLRQYEAALSNQQAKLEESKRGTRPEQIQIAESQAAGARISLESAQRNVIVQLKSAYTSADDAVRNQVDQL